MDAVMVDVNGGNAAELEQQQQQHQQEEEELQQPADEQSAAPRRADEHNREKFAAEAQPPSAAAEAEEEEEDDDDDQQQQQQQRFNQLRKTDCTQELQLEHEVAVPMNNDDRHRHHPEQLRQKQQQQHVEEDEEDDDDSHQQRHSLNNGETSSTLNSSTAASESLLSDLSISTDEPEPSSPIKRRPGRKPKSAQNSPRSVHQQHQLQLQQLQKQQIIEQARTLLKSNSAVRRKRAGSLENSAELDIASSAAASTLALDEVFAGFSEQEQAESGAKYRAISRLIADAATRVSEEPEASTSSPAKRRRMMPWKNLKNADNMIDEIEGNTTDSDDRMIIDSDQTSIPLDESSMKSERSVNSTMSKGSSRSRLSQASRVASPTLAAHRKPPLDVLSPAYRVPFKHGWKRELVTRATGSTADVYYFTPEHKKLRSFREVTEYLQNSKIDPNTINVDNFTFAKESLQVNDESKEILRHAKTGRDVYMKGTPKGTLKATPKIRKPIADSPSVRKVSPPKKVVIEKPVVATPPPPAKNSPKIAKTPGSVFKVKLPVKKEMKTPSPSPIPNPEVSSPPQWSSPTRRSQAVVEKSSAIKTKRLKDKEQDPCSISCPSSIGSIPDLECRVCLRLYHSLCAGILEPISSNSFICKNCQPDDDDDNEELEAQASCNPPPLIPISLIGSPNKVKNPLADLPKLQRIPKSISSESPQRVSRKNLGIRTLENQSEPRETEWFATSESELLQRQRNLGIKPPQNIAFMNGRRYIVVPKPNTKPDQPTSTSIPDKIADSAPKDCDNTVSKVPEAKEVVEDNIDTEETAKENNTITNTNTNIITNISDSPCPSRESAAPSPMDEAPHFSPASLNKSPINDIENEAATNSCQKVSDHDNFTASSIEDENSNQSNKIETLKVNFSPINKRKKQTSSENVEKQNFMTSLCTGYNALSRVFQYLKVQELLRAGRVCKMWRDLASHPTLWKTVRMKNSQVTDWDGFAESLKKRGTQYLDLRKMLIVGETDDIWKQFITVIPRVTSLVKLELCRCPAVVVEEVIKNCPQLQIISATSIKAESISIEPVANLTEIRIKALNGMSLEKDLTPLMNLTSLVHLSLTSIKELGKKNIEVLQHLSTLETLELGECTDLPTRFGSVVLSRLPNLERLRLEKGENTCGTFDILDSISKLEKLNQLELVNFDVKTGFDNYLAACKNLKKLLVIPTYICQSATSNNMVLGGVTKLSSNLTHFIWGVTQELLRVTEIFRDQCQANNRIKVDSIPVLKPVPCYNLITDMINDKEHADDRPASLHNPQIEILPLPHLQKLLITALPKTRVKILKIPYHATWRQSFNDNANQQ